MHITESNFGTPIGRLGHMLTHEVGQSILTDITIWTIKNGKESSRMGNEVQTKTPTPTKPCRPSTLPVKIQALEKRFLHCGKQHPNKRDRCYSSL